MDPPVRAGIGDFVVRKLARLQYSCCTKNHTNTLAINARIYGRVGYCLIMQNLVEALNDTEGLSIGLYYHLWKKTHKGLPCPDVLIPPTVGI